MTKTIQKIIKNWTEYNIKDTTYESKTAVSWWTAVSLVTTGEKYDWNNKQATLVSWTNIKTINNESLLGSWNITISGGGWADIEYVTEAEYDQISWAGSDWKNYFIVEPFPQLLTYAELVDMATNEGFPRNDTVAELNTAKTDYYNMLDAWWNLSTSWNNKYITWITYNMFGDMVGIVFNNNSIWITSDI